MTLDIKGVSDKFQVEVDYQMHYNCDERPFKQIISSLSEKQRDKIFKQGDLFYEP